MLNSTIRVGHEPTMDSRRVLTSEALAFVLALDAKFAERRTELLERRRDRMRAVRAGEGLDFLESTRHIREDQSWSVATPAPSLADRRVEITGPPTRTMTVNALNSGARVWMADFEDATTPTWSNLMEGHTSLMDALDGSLDFTTPEGKQYCVHEDAATIVMRPRGWHLVDKGVVIDGRPISASLLDFGLHAFHCAHRQIARGGVPGFYLPKLESHLEARLWNDVFIAAQEMLGLPRGTFRATVLIETIPAAFEMEEILYELREHSAGLNAGRWDYLFSTIKYHAHDSKFVLPDRSSVRMTVDFMRAYTDLLVQTCHRRGAHAIGGMAAAVPVKSDPQRFEQALVAVRQDKEREAQAGFDGSWVAHPALVPLCDEAFTTAFGPDRTDQRDVLRADVHVTAADLLAVERTPGVISEEGVRANIRTSLRYLAAWLDGFGAVALDGLMEDAATVEIARSQLWQWRRHHSELVDGRHVSGALMKSMIAEEVAQLRSESQGGLSLDRAVQLLTELVMAPNLEPFFTSIAYARWVSAVTQMNDEMELLAS